MAWAVKANCKDMDTDIFFPPDGVNISEEAREICFACDVRDECLNYALLHKLDFGMWGGFSADQRRRMRRNHVYG